jgi:signal transduction histidine kinase/ligand-binding sensor domain-containing protein
MLSEYPHLAPASALDATPRRLLSSDWPGSRRSRHAPLIRRLKVLLPRNAARNPKEPVPELQKPGRRAALHGFRPRHSRHLRPWCARAAAGGRTRAARFTSVAVVAVAAITALLAPPSMLAAQDRLKRQFGGEGGLVPPIVALAQDSVGFLWAGTRAGLFRYDGARFQRWLPDALPRGVGTIVVSPSGMAVAVDADGRIVELTANDARVLPGTARRSPDYTQIAAFDAEDRLWIVADDGKLAWRETNGAWQTLPPDAMQGDTARKLFPGGPNGGVLVASGGGLWHVDAGTSRRLLDSRLIVDALVRDDGEVIALSNFPELVRIRPSTRAEVIAWGTRLPPMRGISLAERNGTLWVGSDRYLLALAPGGATELLGPQQGVIAGGPLLVDREGSLWHGGFTALTQYPEPDTKVWDERHGLRSAHARFLARSGDVVWVTTWQGPSYLRSVGGRWHAGYDVDWWSWGQLCRDEGAVWAGTEDGMLRLQAADAVIMYPQARFHLGMCRRASDGGFWIASGEGIHHLSGDGATLTSVGSLPTDPDADTAVGVVLEDRSGRLWASSRERICHSPAAAVLEGAPAPPDWSCAPLPEGTVHLNSMVELADGTIWAAAATVGVLHQTATGWQPLPDNDRLPTRSVLNLVPSQRGGVWLVGAGIVERVEARPGGSGWTVLERLGAWHGLPSVGGGDLLEEDDGTIWIATSQGVMQVPGTVRTAEPIAPRMALVEGRVDGELVPLDRALVLPADRNRLELRFAALTFRDPGRVRYQVRLSPGDEWSDTEGQPSFTWVDLPPGQHQPQVRASLDGATWSPQPAGLAFSVLPPWYRTVWAITAFALLTGALLFGLYRARLAYLLGLERQRTRIAMDLHDEMGSGLASIGILAGVLSDDGRDAEAGRRIAQEVASTAEELGTSLSDIVWSLDPHSATLEELAARLAEHGGRLFADDVDFDTAFPEQWPAMPLPLPVLRNVLLIGLEALHNAARHAGASSVLLSLLPEHGHWVMTLHDDGAGLPARRTDSARGRGLRAMRRRAAEIGGEITWTSRPGAGTMVRLSFQPSPQRTGLFGWLRRLEHRASPAGGPPDSHDHAGARPDHTVHR